MALTALLNENIILLTDVCTIKCSGSANQFLKNHKIVKFGNLCDGTENEVYLHDTLS